MKKYFFSVMLCASTQAISMSPWLKNLNSPNKQQQIELEWQAYGGQVDIKFMHKKLNEMQVNTFPKPDHPDQHWDNNHLVYAISDQSKLSLQMPYGNIEKITKGQLTIDSNFSFSNGSHSIKVNSFTLVPTEKPLNNSDIVTFMLIDQNNNHLFTIDSVHIQYDKEKQLLLMSNMDLFATHTFAQLLNNPYLENQIVGQINTYNNLKVPENAITEMRGESCANHPVWPPNGDVDVALIDIGSVQYIAHHNSEGLGADQIVIAPSARLKNVGTAEVPWQYKYSGNYPPYDNDQHPFLNWSVYREIDGRFEQLGNSGVKHAFLTINSNCDINCNDSHILWLGCEDVYGVGNNDSTSAIGPRSEINADKGTWDNCGTFFDPQPCTGNQQNYSNDAGQFRLKAYVSDITDLDNTSMYIQAWYLIRDDINIFNSMGYRSINPTQNGGGWNMNAGNAFKNGAALDNYVDPENIGENQATQTVETGEGQFTVAVKVFDLGNGLYRYNYAVENYEFDPRFINYHLPLSAGSQLLDTVFSDPEHDESNDWQFSRDGDVLNLIGNAGNEQDWGMLFSFSFTTDSAPVDGFVTIDAAEITSNSVVSATVITPKSLTADLINVGGFE